MPHKKIIDVKTPSLLNPFRILYILKKAIKLSCFPEKLGGGWTNPSEKY